MLYAFSISQQHNFILQRALYTVSTMHLSGMKVICWREKNISQEEGARSGGSFQKRQV